MLRTYSFVTTSGRDFSRPVLLKLGGAWNGPFVARGFATFIDDLADQGTADAMCFGHFGQQHAVDPITEDRIAIDIKST